MAENIFNRPMFNQPGEENWDPNLNPNPNEPRFGQPIVEETETETETLSYPTPKFTQAQGLAGMDLQTLMTNIVDPEEIKKAYTSYQGEPKTAADFAAVYDGVYDPVTTPEESYRFEKNLALAKFGLGLMQPTEGGAIAPAIASAGQSFIADLASINERKRQERLARGKEETAEQRAKREFILTSLNAQNNARDAGEMSLFMKTLEFNMNNDTRTMDYMRDLNKMFYNYQYDTDADAMSKHYDILKENYKKDPKVLYNPKTGTFAMGYIQNTGPDNIPTPFFPMQDDDGFNYIATPNAVDTNFSLNQKGDLAPSATKLMDIVSKINGSKTTMRFVREIQSAVQANPYIVGIPGLLTKLTQTGTSTIMDVAAYLADKGIIDNEGYDRTISKLQNNALSAMAASYQVNTGDSDAQAFMDDATDEKYEGAIYRAFFNPTIPQNEIRLNSIYYALARARKTTGRLNKDDIDNAKASLSLTGFTSSDDVKAALEQVYEELEAAYNGQMRIFTTFNAPESLISDVEFDSFHGATKGQTVFIDSFTMQDEFGEETGVPEFDETGGGG